MAQQDDINRYLTMKIADWVSVSNPASAAYDPGFVASINDAWNRGLIPILNNLKEPYGCGYKGASGGVYNGPSISGKDKVS